MSELGRGRRQLAAADGVGGLAPATQTARGALGATLLVVATLTIMSGATIAPALPAIEARFQQVDGAGLLTRLVLTLPALFVALCGPLAGFLADRFGRRRLLVGSIAVYGLAGMSGLVLNSLVGLLAGLATANSLVFYLIPTQLPFHLNGLGIALPSRAGLAIGLFTLASAATALGYGGLRRHLGIPCIFGLAFGVLAAGFAVLAVAATFEGVVAALLIGGTGLGLVMPNLITAALGLAPAGCGRADCLHFPRPVPVAAGQPARDRRRRLLRHVRPRGHGASAAVPAVGDGAAMGHAVSPMK